MTKRSFASAGGASRRCRPGCRGLGCPRLGGRGACGLGRRWCRRSSRRCRRRIAHRRSTRGRLRDDIRGFARPHKMKARPGKPLDLSVSVEPFGGRDQTGVLDSQCTYFARNLGCFASLCRNRTQRKEQDENKTNNGHGCEHEPQSESPLTRRQGGLRRRAHERLRLPQHPGIPLGPGALLRCATTGCTSQRDRCARAHQS